MGGKISSNGRVVLQRRRDPVLWCEPNSYNEKDLQQEKRRDTGQSRLISSVLPCSAGTRAVADSH